MLDQQLAPDMAGLELEMGMEVGMGMAGLEAEMGMDGLEVEMGMAGLEAEMGMAGLEAEMGMAGLDKVGLAGEPDTVAV